MFRRMILPMAAAAIVVGALGFAYQAFGIGDGVSATVAELARGHDGRGHDGHDKD